jgi:hypothetical protein
MIKRVAIILLLASRSAIAVTAEGDAGAAPKLEVNQILEKNVAARGGLDAWRKVQTMLWIGHLQAGSSPEIVPFMMQMKRPDKMRFEVTVDNEKSIRAFDGKEGWKVRPPRTGKPELAPFTPDEVRFAHDAPGIDGPLIDHEAKGIGVELDGVEEIDGHKAYRLTVKLPSGTTRHVWVDATTFLEIRYDRETRSAAGKPGIVFVSYRNYRAIDGLQIPMTIETGSPNGPPGDRMTIDRVLLNPPLEESAFSRPGGPGRRSHVFAPPEAGASPK